MTCWKTGVQVLSIQGGVLFEAEFCLARQLFQRAAFAELA